MTGYDQRSGRRISRAALAAALAFAAAPLAAQDGQFDLRPRATPSPTSAPVVGPVDPENPVPNRPRPTVTAAPPPLTVPDVTPTPRASATPAPAQPRAAETSPASRATPSRPLPPPAGGAPVPDPAVANDVAEPSAAQPVLPPSPAAPAATSVQPRNLDVVAPSRGIGWWLAIGLLLIGLAVAGWLVWSRYFRDRVQALPAPEIERPRLAEAPEAVPLAMPTTADEPAPQPAAAPTTAPAPAPAPSPALVQDLDLTLEATRMTATLMNTALSYRLAVTNRSNQVLKDVRIDGDMIAAHASRPMEPVIGRNAAVLPSLHRIMTLAPGETVTLGGDIRLPLVSITPIRRGNAAFFVPLARLRARATAPTGITVEGGGTYLVGQEPGANRKLQPFRLDLGPRNYSNLGQQLLSAA